MFSCHLLIIQISLFYAWVVLKLQVVGDQATLRLEMHNGEGNLMIIATWWQENTTKELILPF